MADSRPKAPEVPPNEVAAMEERIRRYVDQRLQSTAERLLEPPGFYSRYRVELWGFLILFTLAAQWFWLVSQAPPRAAAASPSPSAAPPPSTVPPSVPSSGAPATAPPAAPPEASAARLPWPDWLRAHPQQARGGLDKLLAEEGVKKGSLSERQRGKAAELRGELALGKTANLDNVHLGKLLFEYVAKRSQGAAASGAIDAAVNDSEYPAAALQRLAAELAVPAGDARLRKDDFQQELVIAWLEKNVPR